MLNSTQDRKKAVGRLSRYLRRYGQPRVQLSLILIFTALVGVALSILLLRLGLEHMWLRYPLAALLAYTTFIACLRFWARRHLDRPELQFELEQMEQKPENESREFRPNLKMIDIFDFFTFADDVPVFLLIIVALIVIVVLATVLLAAPVLLAEVLLDGLLVAGLWHRLKHQGKARSIWGALQATRVPAVIVILGLGVIGLLLEKIEPTARSIGDVFRSLTG